MRFKFINLRYWLEPNGRPFIELWANNEGEAWTLLAEIVRHHEHWGLEG